LDIEVPTDENGKAAATVLRDQEAEAVADLCQQLIQARLLLDRKTGTVRQCRPGDIALLAPTGSDLWRYEEALERRGIPVATQAGKGFYRRQEVQDLIALTRTLADRRDTVALGALLRGPLIGLTEEELLDIVWALPRSPDEPDALPRLHLWIDTGLIEHTLARDVFSRLQALAKAANSTTPYDLLCQAVDQLRVRPLLLQRHHGRAERALANVDRYLALAQPYAVRGLRAFAEAMTTAWTDEERAGEGRPDAQEEAVSLYTMHSAKGLEWPIVIPINTMTKLKAPDADLVDPQDSCLFCPVLGVHPVGYDEVRAREKTELDFERVRLWYVAATRAREVLIMPRLSTGLQANAWHSILELDLAKLPAVDLTAAVALTANPSPPVINGQTRDVFAAEAARIRAYAQPVTWAIPSRGEDMSDAQLVEDPNIWGGDTASPAADVVASTIQGGRARGLIIHKLFEEVLTGEVQDDQRVLAKRADSLIRELCQEPCEDPQKGLSSTEIADCIHRALRLPQVADVRAFLIPEFPVYASELKTDVELITLGIADAVATDAAGKPSLVIDWKSDVAPKVESIEQYQNQVRCYLRATGASQGLIVFVTTSEVVHVHSGLPN
jgi:exodeoxyribonuclease-5